MAFPLGSAQILNKKICYQMAIATERETGKQKEVKKETQLPLSAVCTSTLIQGDISQVHSSRSTCTHSYNSSDLQLRYLIQKYAASPAASVRPPPPPSTHVCTRHLQTPKAKRNLLVATDWRAPSTITSSPMRHFTLVLVILAMRARRASYSPKRGL